MKLARRALTSGLWLLFVNTPISIVYAQSNDEDQTINEVESIFDKDSEKDTEPVAPPSVKEEAIPDSISNLKNLQPFSDVAVIQRKFLPKTKRFEGYGGGAAIVNNAFFMNYGLHARLGYNFSENFGADIVYMYLKTTNRDVTDDLSTKRGIRTDGLVSPDMYFGGSVSWTPVYGKMSLFDNRIVPFDMFFSAGGGITKTNQGTNSPTFQIGAGQRFAIGKTSAFRWDFTWNFYSATYRPASTNSGPIAAETTGTFDNLFLSLGFSFFFPEATYR